MKNNRSNEFPCTFQISKLAKEKGYVHENNFMQNYYNYKGTLNGDSTEHVREIIQNRKILSGDKEVKPIQRKLFNYENIDAPSQATLQEWLRKRGLIVAVVPLISDQLRFKWIIYDKQVQILKELSDTYAFLTWEDALEEGLEWGLKILK